MTVPLELQDKSGNVLFCAAAVDLPRIFREVVITTLRTMMGDGWSTSRQTYAVRAVYPNGGLFRAVVEPTDGPDLSTLSTS